jgi:hypothetical protein
MEKNEDWDHSCVGADCKVLGCPRATPKPNQPKKNKENN